MTTTTVTDNRLDRLYTAVEQGTPIDAELFASDVVFDATVPMLSLIHI